MQEKIYDTEHFEILFTPQQYFDFGQVNDYKEKAKKHSENKVLLSDFSDDIWKMEYSNAYHYFHFSYKDKEINTQLKCFLLSELEQGYRVSTLSLSVSAILKVITFTDNYSTSKIEEFEKWFEEQKEHTKLKIQTSCQRLWRFLGPPKCQEYEDLLSEFAFVMGETRELPNYRDILYFDHCLKDFQEKSEGHLRKRYLPLFIWWKLSKIIPMRTSELLAIKEANIKETAHGTVLKLERNKFKYAYAIPIQTEFNINEEVTELMREYIRNKEESTLSELYSEEENSYLFPHYLNLEFQVESAKNRSLARKSKATKHLPRHGMGSLLKQFYREIIEKDYNLQLEQLRPMDTRHLAICGMMMQGFSPLTIARLAGHADLRSQNHYLQHIEIFNEAATNVLADNICREEIIKMKLTLSEDDIRLPAQFKLNMKKGKFMKYDTDSFLKLENGYCTDKDFPSNCQMACETCKFFLFSSDKMEHKKALLAYNEKIVKQKEDTLTLFEATYKSLMTKTDRVNMIDNTHKLNESKGQIELVKRIVEQHAVIKAKILLEDNKEWLDHKNTLITTSKSEL